MVEMFLWIYLIASLLYLNHAYCYRNPVSNWYSIVGYLSDKKFGVSTLKIVCSKVLVFHLMVAQIYFLHSSIMIESVFNFSVVGFLSVLCSYFCRIVRVFDALNFDIDWLLFRRVFITLLIWFSFGS